MMNARRKQKAAASTKTTKTNKTASTTAEGPMRSIALGRKYREYEAPVDEDGVPAFRSIFDPQGRAAKAITEAEVSKNRVVNNSAFVAHINETVFRQVFGMPLRRKVARMLLEGIADQSLVLIEQGWKIKQSNFVTAERVHRKARKARNPKTGAEVHVPARWAMKATATRSARAYMAES